MATHKALPLISSKYLNFEVVGSTTQPTNPKENTIWVGTTVPITSWSIDGRAPDNTNFVKSPFYSAAGTWNGITYTVSNNSLTVNGTATQETYFFFRGKDVNDALPLNKGIYTINGCPTGGVHGSTYSLEFGVSYDGCTTWEYAVDYGSGATMYVSESVIAEVVFIIYSGATVNNLTISPQLKRISSSDTEPTVGQIRIKTLNSGGYLSFNALKTNMIDTHLDKAYQWNGSEWVELNGYVYHNSEYVQISGFDMIYLYDNGVQNVAWRTQEGGYGSGSVSYNDDYVTLTATGSYSNGARYENMYTTEMIDLTEYTTLKAVVSGYAYGNNGIVQNGDNDHNGYFRMAITDAYWDDLGCSEVILETSINPEVATDDLREVSLDISNITGSYYIAIGIKAYRMYDYSNTGYVYSVSLHK